VTKRRKIIRPDEARCPIDRRSMNSPPDSRIPVGRPAHRRFHRSLLGHPDYRSKCATRNVFTPEWHWSGCRIAVDAAFFAVRHRSYSGPATIWENPPVLPASQPDLPLPTYSDVKNPAYPTYPPSGGDRTCLSFRGEQISLRSAKHREGGFDLTSELAKGYRQTDFFFVNGAEISDCKELL
jgi:hypothetical protein